MDRNLDGYYFRVERDGRFESVCWSDLTEEQRYKAIEDYGPENLKRFCVGLGDVIRQIGDECDIVCD